MISKPIPITIPLINPNESEALLAALHVEEGQLVAEDDLICTLETTKSTVEVVAEDAGYVIGMRFAEGETVRAGDLLCYLAESPEARPLGVESHAAGNSSPASTESDSLPAGLRITHPALNLVRERGLSLDEFPLGPLITVKMVTERLVDSAGKFVIPQSDFDATAIVIYGGGGHGKSLLDLLRALGVYHVVGFVDDSLPSGEKIMGVPVLGAGDVLPELHQRGLRLAVNAVGGIGNVSVRVKVFGRIAEAGFGCPALVHPSAFVEPGAMLSPGVQVFPHAYVGSDVQVGFGSIVNTGAIVSHDCILGDCVNISPGAILAGDVKVGDGALIGMGVTVNLRVRVGAGARVGNSAVVKSDLPSNGVVRAGTIWPLE
ncbi:MAG: NeuD/PglB/VioB family sugar acetyltransferase [Chloroflexota bacterium]|nr:NeuD/PglB/VioB family sugar acetyltransferase [Chloroflexota bacterium]